jgi:hypothetical protein
MERCYGVFQPLELTLAISRARRWPTFQDLGQFHTMEAGIGSRSIPDLESNARHKSGS